MRRRLLIPEVLQSSATDCGPAALKSLFGGFGIGLSYGRLREACQTDVDGTSIDTMEALARQLGLAAQQCVVPADFVLPPNSGCLPAIAVTTLPDGATHFVVVWRVTGTLVQIMDPAAGRIWLDRRRFLDSLYIHEQGVPRDDWLEWTRSDVFLTGIDERLRALDLPQERWSDVVAQDAALRLAGAMRHAGKLRGRQRAVQLLDLCKAAPQDIPDAFWSARPIAEDHSQVLLRGAVLLTVAQGAAPEANTANLSPALERIRQEAPARPWTEVLGAARRAGAGLCLSLLVAVIAAALATVFEALLLRGFLDVGHHLEVPAQRVIAGVALLTFVGALAALDWSAALLALRLGRRIEVDLRMRWAHKIPRLADGYFRSRTLSDMAYRAHWLQLLRHLPEAGSHAARLVALLIFTVAAVVWLRPEFALPVTLSALLAVAIPLAALPALNERDLRVRETSAALSRLHFDAMQGARAVQSHGAQATLLALQAGQLRRWRQAVLRRQRLLAWADTLQTAATLLPIIFAVMTTPTRIDTLSGLLLLVYWVVSMPIVSRDLAAVLWTFSGQRSTLLRFLEPLGAPEEAVGTSIKSASENTGLAIRMRGLTASPAGHVVLDGIDLDVAPGEHIAIVGLSGAGKSSLVGLLLGWFPSFGGELRIDGEVIDPPALAALREKVAWIDPDVHLFAGSLFDNLCYGNAPASVAPAARRAGVHTLLPRLPGGMHTRVTEGGASLSGGEAQQVRLARGLAREGVRLVILDEAARGLGRERRRQLTVIARQRFARATLLCVSHDIADTLAFDRVLVMHEGRIVEDASPATLRADKHSRYRQLLDDEAALASTLWASPRWRQLCLRAGQIVEQKEATA